MWWLSTECETSGPGVNWIWVRHTGASGEWRVSLDLEVVGVNYGSAQCPKPNRISRALRHCLQQLCMAQTTSAFLPPGTTTADPSSGADQSTLPQPGDDLQLGACSTATAVANVAFPSPIYNPYMSTLPFHHTSRSPTNSSHLHIHSRVFESKV